MSPVPFGSTTLPLLEQVLGFTQARQAVLAGNIANLDTPGYRVRDLSVSGFQSRLREAIEQRDRPQARGDTQFLSQHSVTGAPDYGDPFRDVSKHVETILYHDDSNVGVEQQVTEMIKNQMQHNMALSIMTNQFNLLHAAISERA